MSRIATILLGVLALAAVIFLAIYEPLTKNTRENNAAIRSGQVLDLDPSQVRLIRITAGDKELVLKRRGNGWQVEGEFKDRAAAALVGQTTGADADDGEAKVGLLLLETDVPPKSGVVVGSVAAGGGEGRQAAAAAAAAVRAAGVVLESEMRGEGTACKA